MRGHSTYLENGLATQRRLEFEENDVDDGHAGGCDGIEMMVFAQDFQAFN